MLVLVLSILALLLGPVLLVFSRRGVRLDALIYAFVLVATGGILLFDVLPMSVANGGWWVLLPAILGFLGPTLIESAFHRAADTTHKTALVVGVIGLALHGSIDGIALVQHDQQSPMLPYAIILHRIAVGLTVWWLLRPYLGRYRALFVIVLMCGTTIGGYLLGGDYTPRMDQGVYAGFQALVAGTLLHVVLHRPHGHGHRHSHEAVHRMRLLPHWDRRLALWYLAGMIAGAILLISQIAIPGHP